MKIKSGTFIIIILTTGIGAGLFLATIFNQNTAVVSTTLGNCSYKYLNPLRCEPEQAKQKKEYVTLRNTLSTFIAQEKQKGTVTHVSIYFRDLQNGPSIHIAGQEPFAPASLLKIPLMMTYYKKAEEDPSLLTKKLQIVGDITAFPQNIKPQQTIEKGQEYTIDEIIEILITESDNTSQELLLKYLKQEYSEEDFIETMSDLGIIDPRQRNVEQYIPVQIYASLFRALYNASYLNIEMSNKALDLLAHSKLTTGIVAGVPSDIEVSHKFGEVKYGDQQQFHDCGIIYYPSNPYLLCIMTRGETLQELQPVVQHISKEVYQEVDSRRD